MHGLQVLNSQSGIEPASLALKALSLNHWTAREFPGIKKFRTEKRRANTERTHEVNETDSLCSIHPCFMLSPLNCLLKQ